MLHPAVGGGAVLDASSPYGSVCSLTLEGAGKLVRIVPFVAQHTSMETVQYRWKEMVSALFVRS